MNDSLYSRQVVVLFGSPNIVGSTFRLLEQFKQALSEQGTFQYTYREFSLFDMDIMPCNNCGCCQYGLCHMNHLDGYSEIIEAIQSADIVIVATPVYFAGYPAPLKAFLDRCQQFYVKKFRGKRYCFPRRTQGFLLATSGQKDPNINTAMAIGANMFFHCINAEFSGTLISDNTDKEPNFYADFEEIMNSVSKEL